ncbi:unnamed protein product [Discosporangium mesarthrocarpum]
MGMVQMIVLVFVGTALSTTFSFSLGPVVRYSRPASTGRVVRPVMKVITSGSSLVDRVPRSLNDRASQDPRAAVKTVESNTQESAQSAVRRIATEEEYYGVLAANPDTLVVVKFFAPWCRSCKAMDLRYQRLAKENPDIQFFDVDVADSPDLKKALGVRVVPFVKLHAGMLGQIASFTCGPRKVPQLERKLSLCKDVPGLIEKVTGSTSTGMMESYERRLISVLKAQPGDTAAASTVSSVLTVSPESSDQGEVEGGKAAYGVVRETVGVVTGLMEKLARKEKMARALGNTTLSVDLSMPTLSTT